MRDCRGVVTINSSDGTVVRNRSTTLRAREPLRQAGARRIASSPGVEESRTSPSQRGRRLQALVVVNTTRSRAFAVRVAGRFFAMLYRRARSPRSGGIEASIRLVAREIASAFSAG